VISGRINAVKGCDGLAAATLHSQITPHPINTTAGAVSYCYDNSSTHHAPLSLSACFLHYKLGRSGLVLYVISTVCVPRHPSSTKFGTNIEPHIIMHL